MPDDTWYCHEVGCVHKGPEPCILHWQREDCSLCHYSGTIEQNGTEIPCPHCGGCGWVYVLLDANNLPCCGHGG